MRIFACYTTLARIIVVAATLLCCQSATAALHTFYEENFNDGNNDGVTGPGVFVSDIDTEGNWLVDGIGLAVGDSARQESNEFRFVNSGVNGPLTSPTSISIFTTTPVLIPGGPYTFLTMTMTVTQLPLVILPGTEFTIESVVNGALTTTTRFNSAMSPSTSISHDLLPWLLPGVNTFQLRITATQNLATTFAVDDILVSGDSAPEPASLSMLGMGVLVMYGAGYRRRRRRLKS